MPTLATADAISPALYRSPPSGGDHRGAHLLAARDALEMAILCLGGEAEGGCDARCGQARAFLVEAVRALGAARVYDGRVRTLSVAVVMACEDDPEAEANRLYALATRLAWDNHALLPPKAEARPLPPEDERQLARLSAGLRRHARLERVFRGRMAALSVGAFALAALAGAGTVELVLLGGIAATLVGGAAAALLRRR